MNTLLSVRKVCTDVMSSTSTGVKFRTLIAKIRKTFRLHDIELEIKTRLISKLEPNEFYVNAYYDQESDSQGDCAIEVIVYHNIKLDSTFEFTQLSQFLVQIYDAVTHEFRHREQGRRRHWKPNLRITDESDTRGYLSDPDEIDAYSLSIAVELIRNLGKQRSLTYLHRASRLANIRPKGLFASPTLFHYYRIFGDLQNKVLRKLVKKVFLNLQTLDESAIFY